MGDTKETVTIECRCKNCRYYTPKTESFGFCKLGTPKVMADNFCSHGQKKEGLYISKNFVEDEISKIKNMHEIPIKYTNGKEISITGGREIDAFERGLNVALAIVYNADAINFDLEKKFMCMDCKLKNEN